MNPLTWSAGFWLKVWTAPAAPAPPTPRTHGDVLLDLVERDRAGPADEHLPPHLR